MPVLSRIERTGALIDGGLLGEQSKELADRAFLLAVWEERMRR